MRSKIVLSFAVALTLLACNANAQYMGDYAVGTDNICRYFRTAQPSTGASFTIASEAVDVYSDDSATQDPDDSGLTLDDDFDGVTGFHQICVDTSSDGTFYSAGKTFTVMLSAGTVDSVSVVGEPILIFTLAKNSSLKPTTAGRALDVSAGGEAGIDWANIGSPTTTVGLTGTTVDLVTDAVDSAALASTVTVDITGNISTVTTVNGFANDALVAADIAPDVATELQSGLATAAALATVDDFVDTEVATLIEALIGLGAEQTADSGTTTTIVDAALTQATNDWFKGMGVHFTSGTLLGQDACVTGFTAASDTLTFAPAATTAVTTHNYYLLPDSECFSGASGSGATAQEVWEYATRGLTILDEDSTTIDLNNSFVGGVTTFDEDSTTIDINATTLGTVTNLTTVSSGAISEASYATTAGSFAPLGVTDQGTSPSAATPTTLVLRAATPFSSDDANKGQTLWAFGSDQGYWQSETITAYATATDTATVNTWDVTPSGTITYKIFGTAESAAGAGGGATAQEVWEYGTRYLTSLDEDLTTLDLNATTIGTLATLDEDTTTFDLNATTIGTVTTATNVTNVNGLGAGVITAAAVATGAFDADAAATDLSTEIWSAATRSLTILDEDSTTLDLDASTIGTATNIGGTSLRTGLGMASANLDTQLTNIESGVDIDTIEGVDATDSTIAILQAILATSQRLIVSTTGCDSGSTTTCVDNAFTQATEEQLKDRVICFDDSWCALITGFNPATDTVTTTKVAPSTRASKLYTIFPATAL